MTLAPTCPLLKTFARLGWSLGVVGGVQGFNRGPRQISHGGVHLAEKVGAVGAHKKLTFLSTFVFVEVCIPELVGEVLGLPVLVLERMLSLGRPLVFGFGLLH